MPFFIRLKRLGEQAFLATGHGGLSACNAAIRFKSKDGVWTEVYTNKKYWRAIPILLANAVALPTFVTKYPADTWPRALQVPSPGKLVKEKASFLWGPKPAGTVVLMTILGGPEIPNVPQGTVAFNCAKTAWLYVNGKLVKSSPIPDKIATWTGPLKVSDTVLIKAEGGKDGYGCTARVEYPTVDGKNPVLLTDMTHWYGTYLEEKEFKNVVAAIAGIPKEEWPIANSGTHAKKVDPKAEIIWGDDVSGYAAIWAILGDAPVRENDARDHLGSQNDPFI